MSDGHDLGQKKLVKLASGMYLQCTVHDSSSPSTRWRRYIAHFPRCPSCFELNRNTVLEEALKYRAVWWCLLSSLKFQSNWNSTFSVKSPRTSTNRKVMDFFRKKIFLRTRFLKLPNINSVFSRYRALSWAKIWFSTLDINCRLGFQKLGTGCHVQ